MNFAGQAICILRLALKPVGVVGDLVRLDRARERVRQTPCHRQADSPQVKLPARQTHVEQLVAMTPPAGADAPVARDPPLRARTRKRLHVRFPVVRICEISGGIAGELPVLPRSI
jgi:hypothetical protein